MEIALSKEDKPEILRYLEYRKHDIDENLDRQLDRCMDLINKAARPKYISKVVDISNGIPKDCTFIKGFDILKHLGGAKKMILMAATLGPEVEFAIRKAQIRDVSDALIMDSCASTLVEELCDRIEAEFRTEYEKEGLYLSTRYSPGYGDMPISVQREFTVYMDTVRRIGLNVSESGIMIPRKSVTAIKAITKEKNSGLKRNCGTCNIREACRFLRRGTTCGI